MGSDSDPANAWRLYVLGAIPRLERGDERLVPDRRTAALLALLAFEGPMPRERAAALLWPDRPAARARANLRQLLYRLRAHADVLEDVPLALQGDVVTDADAIREVRTGLVGPIEPMRGHDLEGLDEVAERLAAAGARARERIRADLVGQIRDREQKGDLAAAVEAARTLAAIDPLDEASTRVAMRLQIASGEPAGALATYARTRDALRAELGVGPTPETAAIAEQAASAASTPLGGRGVVAPDAAWGAPAARRAEAGGWLVEGAALLRAAAHGLEPGPQQARLLVQLAWLEHQLGRHAAAMEAAEAGLSLLAPDADDGARIEGWFVLGSIARMRGDLDSAAEWWRRALDLAERRAGGEENLALRVNLGMVEDSLGRTDAALANYLAAAPLAEAQGDTATLVVLWINIGHALLARGDTERARPLLVRAVQSARNDTQPRLHAYALDGLAACELARGDAPRARSLAGTALAAARELGDPGLQVQAAATLADAAHATGDVSLARSTARAALVIANRHRDLPGSMRAALALARADGPDARTSRRAVAHLAVDPRAAPDIRASALVLAAAWSVPTESAAADAATTAREELHAVPARAWGTGEHAASATPASGIGVASAWDALVAELVTPR